MLMRSFPLPALATIALVPLLVSPALGQTLPGPSPLTSVEDQWPSQDYRLIHVNALSGSDVSGDGSQFRPLQSIHHALQMAEPNSIILLDPGEYGTETGENFPIMLRPGVTIQGAVAPELGEVIVRGNGTFVNAAGAYMQATIIGVDGAGLGHVTVTNPSPSGYGLVVESGRPVIRANHFIGNGYAGAYVGGNASPLFEENLFANNGSVGLVLTDQSRAQVNGNIFESTGTGIQVDPGAEPQISNNRIVSNLRGMVVAADAEPQLFNNEIARNRQNALIEYTAANKAATPEPSRAHANAPRPLLQGQPATAITPEISSLASPPEASSPLSLAPPPQPDPGQSLQAPPQTSSAEPASPSASPSEASSPLSLAPPPQPDPGQSLEAPPQASAAEPAPSSASLEANSGPEAIDSTNWFPSLPLATALALADGDAGQGTVAALQAVAQEVGTVATAVTERTASTDTPIRQDEVATEDPVEPFSSEVSTPVLPATNSTNADPVTGFLVSDTTTAVPIQVIPPAVETSAGAADRSSTAADVEAVDPSPAESRNLARVMNLPTLPEVNPNGNELLQVPEGSIPTGNGSSSDVPVLAVGASPSNPSEGEPPPPPSRAATLGLFYRVVVPAPEEAIQHQVRSLVPDAFRVEVDEQLMMQAGAYSTQAEAEALAAELRDRGLNAEVIYIP